MVLGHPAYGWSGPQRGTRRAAEGLRIIRIMEALKHTTVLRGPVQASWGTARSTPKERNIFAVSSPPRQTPMQLVIRLAVCKRVDR